MRFVSCWILAAVTALSLTLNNLHAEDEAEASALALIKRTDRDPAPDFGGASGWINIEKAPTLADLKGKIVLVDFWTFGCINCIHIFPDLKKLEEKYAKELVVIAVHSGKFAHEGGTENIRNAALRYNLEHPVANDDKYVIWKRFGAESWPTLVLIDPEGKTIGAVSGEGNYKLLDLFISKAVQVFDEKKLIDRKKVIGKPEKRPATPLFFPAKIASQPEKNRLFIADTNHHRILVSDPNGVVSDVIGSGKLGLADGDFATASFHMPHGMAVDGDTVYVADCENHSLRKIDLKTKKVETIAGTGKQVHVNDGGPAKTTPLNSPWDLALSPDKKTLYIAMAGDHRIWHMDLVTKDVRVLAGNGRESLVDGTFSESSYAQPSGLSLHDGTLYVADCEASAVRALDIDQKLASTIIGYDGQLFTFGDVDGKNGTAKLQHALAVLYHDGKLFCADTYNNKIKILDPKEKTATTFLGDGQAGKDDGKAPRFYEPAGLAILGEKLYIADTANHLIRVADLKTKEVKTLEIKLPK